MNFSASRAFSAPLAGRGALGLKDDVALIDGPAGTQYVLKTDAIVEGVHYFRDDPAELIAQKLLRVNLSDLAAKGAEPVGYLLTTALTAWQDDAWLTKFSKGLAADQRPSASCCSAATAPGRGAPRRCPSTPSAASRRAGRPVATARGPATQSMSGTLGDAAPD